MNDSALGEVVTASAEHVTQSLVVYPPVSPMTTLVRILPRGERRYEKGPSNLEKCKFLEKRLNSPATIGKLITLRDPSCKKDGVRSDFSTRG